MFDRWPNLASAYGRFPDFSQKARLPDGKSVAFTELFIMRITVAGTVQVFHLIPFYVAMDHRDITICGCKGIHFPDNMQEKRREYLKIDLPTMSKTVSSAQPGHCCVTILMLVFFCCCVYFSQLLQRYAFISVPANKMPKTQRFQPPNFDPDFARKSSKGDLKEIQGEMLKEIRIIRIIILTIRHRIVQNIPEIWR